MPGFGQTERPRQNERRYRDFVHFAILNVVFVVVVPAALCMLLVHTRMFQIEPLALLFICCTAIGWAFSDSLRIITADRSEDGAAQVSSGSLAGRAAEAAMYGFCCTEVVTHPALGELVLPFYLCVNALAFWMISRLERRSSSSAPTG